MLSAVDAGVADWLVRLTLCYIYATALGPFYKRRKLLHTPYALHASPNMTLMSARVGWTAGFMDAFTMLICRLLVCLRQLIKFLEACFEDAYCLHAHNA